MKIIEISEKDLRLDDVVERGAGCCKRSLQILEHVDGLQLDIRAVIGKVLLSARLHRHSVLELAGKLAGGKDQIPGDESLVIVGERTRHIRLYDLDAHVSPIRCLPDHMSPPISCARQSL